MNKLKEIILAAYMILTPTTTFSQEVNFPVPLETYNFTVYPGLSYETTFFNTSIKISSPALIPLAESTLSFEAVDNEFRFGHKLVDSNLESMLENEERDLYRITFETDLIVDNDWSDDFVERLGNVSYQKVETLAVRTPAGISPLISITRFKRKCSTEDCSNSDPEHGYTTFCDLFFRKTSEFARLNMKNDTYIIPKEEVNPSILQHAFDPMTLRLKLTNLNLEEGEDRRFLGYVREDSDFVPIYLEIIEGNIATISFNEYVGIAQPTSLKGKVTEEGNLEIDQTLDMESGIYYAQIILSD
jgi:hypothetical protein